MSTQYFRTACAALIGVALCSTTVFAQSIPPRPADGADELVTDRPDFTESSEVITPGSYQIESGFAYEVDEHDRTMTVPSTLMRIGLGRRTEFRLSADGFVSGRTDGARHSGHSDFEVGAKIRLLHQDAAGVDMAVIPMVSMPTGSRALSSGAFDPTLKLTWARDLPWDFGVSGNFNMASVSDEHGRFRQGAVSVSLGRDLFGGWGGYVESYGLTPMARGDGAGVTLNGGISHPMGKHAQFDVETGRGVTNAAPNWFVGFGFAMRGTFGPLRTPEFNDGER